MLSNRSSQEKCKYRRVRIKRLWAENVRLSHFTQAAELMCKVKKCGVNFLAARTCQKRSSSVVTHDVIVLYGYAWTLASVHAYPYRTINVLGLADTQTNSQACTHFTCTRLAKMKPKSNEQLIIKNLPARFADVSLIDDSKCWPAISR